MIQSSTTDTIVDAVAALRTSRVAVEVVDSHLEDMLDQVRAPEPRITADSTKQVIEATRQATEALDAALAGSEIF